MKKNLLKPEHLRCEFNINPIGVFTQNPVLSWNAQNPKRGSFQTAYQVVASSSIKNLADGIFDKWDSGKVKSRKSCFINYEGENLHSAERVFWRVKIWDEDDLPSEWSDSAYFEMGLLDRSEWKGRWMGFLGGMHGNGILLRREFSIDKKPIKARANICGLGYYELRLNGEKIGDKLLDPGATDTSKTLLYSIYDVTQQLKQGKNVVGIILGNGWAGCPKALLQLNIDFEDGTTDEIITDWGIGWDVAEGPIIYNSIYDGEDYDAREEKDGWDTAAYDMDKVWQRPGGWILATIVEDPGGELIPEISEPVRITESIKPKLDHSLEDGSLVYDVGKNLTGIPEIKVKGEPGARVIMKFAEVLDEVGDLNTVPLRLARCQDTYILRGKPEGEHYMPRFTYHGFRYMRLRTEGKVDVEDITIHFTRSDLAKNAAFDCSDDFLNRLEQVMWHTEACNMFSIPTDCCQRDERHGWHVDAVNRVEGSTYHFDVASFYEKWLRDTFDTQDEAGYVADTAPHRWGTRPCEPMVNTPFSLPLLLYRTYGNKRVLEQYYPNMKKYIGALIEESAGLILSRQGYGEWVTPASECVEEPNGPGAFSKNVSFALVNTAYFYLDLKQLAEISTILGMDEDAAATNALAQKVKNAYNKTFFDQKTCQYDQGTQSANAISLAFELVPDGLEQKVLDNLLEKIIERDFHLTTGNQGTKLVFEVLSRYGRQDTACTLMQQKTSPSFGYMLENGATTLWERWEADRDNDIMNSRNHAMHASCCTWFYKHLAGIQPAADAVGFDRVLISPVIPTQLEFAESTLTIMAGTVRSAWRKVENGLEMDVSIPFNTQAEIRIPILNCKSEGPQLYEAGALITPAKLPEGISSIAQHKTHFSVHAGSGDYCFAVKSLR